jgi:hypothetical protein
MKKTLIAALSLTLLAGCGLPLTMSPQAQKTQTLNAQSRTSFAKLQKAVLTYYKTVYKPAASAQSKGKTTVTVPATLVQKGAQAVHTAAIMAFIALDTDGDLMLTSTEMANSTFPTFRDANFNGNARVTFSEYEEAIAKGIETGVAPAQFMPPSPNPAPAPQPPASGSANPTPASGSVNPAPASGSVTPAH